NRQTVRDRSDAARFQSRSLPQGQLRRGKTVHCIRNPGREVDQGNEEVSVTLRIDKGDAKRARYATATETLVASSLSRATYERLSQAHLIAALIEREDGSNWKLELPGRRLSSRSPLNESEALSYCWHSLQSSAYCSGKRNEILPLSNRRPGCELRK